MKQPAITMSPNKFEAARKRFGRLSDETIEMARLVLVEGKGQTEIAKQYGLSRQRVSLAVKQVNSAIEDIPKGWVKLEIWMPSAMANRVKKMADEARKSAA